MMKIVTYPREPAMYRECDAENPDELRSLFGPLQIDQLIRQAIQFCWMAMPAERKNADEIEKEVRRIVDRALRDFREDQQSFGPSVH